MYITNRVLSKEHGAYRDFIKDLRDALFIINQDDLDACIRVLKDKKKMSDQDIERKMYTDYDWFLRRVRRTVPTPPELEERYIRVYNAYKDIVCVKKNKALFSSAESKKAHKSLLKHIRRNCVSDVPFVNYYIPVREDKNGLTIYLCIRGTSKNEGLHQKLRQLLRGFSNSPRFVLALVSDFMLRWNQNIDVNVRGLPKLYDAMFDGELLEAEIEKMWKSKQRRTTPHPEWISSRDVVDTEERFGIIGYQEPDKNIDSDGGVCSDESLRGHAVEVEEDLLDMETPANTSDFLNLTGSQAWLAAVNHRKRADGKVSCKDEWDFFNANLLNFQGRSDDADNYTNINFSAFSEHWNKWVDGLGKSKPDVTYKNAAYLNDAYKRSAKRATRNSTLRPHREELKTIRQQNSDATINQSFAHRFVEPERVSTARPAPMAATTRESSTQTIVGNTEENNNDESGEAPAAVAVGDNELGGDSIVDDDANAGYADDEREHNESQSSCRSQQAGTKRRTRAYSSPRCRKCGHQYSANEWKPLHIIPQNAHPSSRAQRLPNQAGRKVADFCRVPPEQRKPGYPWPEGKPMPRAKKQKNS